MFKTFKSYNELPEKSFGVLPDGDYEIMAESGKVGTNKNGDTYANIMFNIRKDVEPKQTGGGRKLFHNFTMNEVGEEYILRFLQCAGIPEEHVAMIDSMETFVKVVTGKPVRARIGSKNHWKNAGEKENYVKWFEKSQCPFVKPENREEERPVYEAEPMIQLPEGALPF